jgi:RHS repeat-associated protein
VLAELDREAWGKATVGGEATPIRFQGQYADRATGLHYNRFRYYDPEAGLYLSPDPIGLPGGLRAYGYGINPTGWIDPLGLARLPQDARAKPKPPKPLPTARPVSKSATQNRQCQADIAAAGAGATDIRVNQQQVDASGNRVGINRPDLQYTDATGQRHYIEYDSPSSGRGPGHQQRIMDNDAVAHVSLKVVP